ncbi:head GIN domain-containing protein [Abyssalbus ytuae]|uniref:DUF2807 domain-containing protein n=1 Tax=Abyssalbus ytuae TaxID=2926907 RepID=A0A9E7D0Y1_9FLAO|nr:head GIN domain-containing protein [Abyssalbus ytuae]UOB18835.1 DUF2807 domain-containing protein [Abyssalbus ytuae]
MKNSIATFCLILLSYNVFSQHVIEKKVGEFNQVKVFDLIEVNLIRADENKVMIKGRNVEDIEIVNKNGVLKVRMVLDKIFHGEDTFVEVYYTNLNVIDGNEGSRITLNELVKQDNIELRVQEGAYIRAGLEVEYAKIRAVTGGIIEASGLAKYQEIVLNTGGIFEGKSLETQSSDVKITAAGEAEVFATKRVDINVKAGGDVYVYGNPAEVSKKTFAGGRIKIMD